MVSAAAIPHQPPIPFSKLFRISDSVNPNVLPNPQLSAENLQFPPIQNPRSQISHPQNRAFPSANLTLSKPNPQIEQPIPLQKMGDPAITEIPSSESLTISDKPNLLIASHPVKDGFFQDGRSFAEIVGISSPSLSPSFAELVSSGKSDLVAVRSAQVFDDEPFISVSPAEISTLSSWFRLALVGKFSRRKPSLSDIDFGLKALKPMGKFSVGHLDKKKHVILNFELEEDYFRIFLQQSCLICGVRMRLLKYTYDFTPSVESPIVPVWISLHKLPLVFFDIAILFSIAAVLGSPLMLDAPTANKSRTHLARICVEIDVSKLPVNRIRLGNDDFSIWQPILYERVPSYCSFCKHLGHSVDICFWKQNVGTFVHEKIAAPRPDAAGNCLQKISGPSPPKDKGLGPKRPQISAPFQHDVSVPNIVIRPEKEVPLQNVFFAPEKEIKTRRFEVRWHSEGEDLISQPLEESYFHFSDGDAPKDLTINNLQIPDYVKGNISSFVQSAGCQASDPISGQDGDIVSGYASEPDASQVSGSDTCDSVAIFDPRKLPSDFNEAKYGFTGLYYAKRKRQREDLLKNAPTSVFYYTSDNYYKGNLIANDPRKMDSDMTWDNCSESSLHLSDTLRAKIDKLLSQKEMPVSPSPGTISEFSPGPASDEILPGLAAPQFYEEPSTTVVSRKKAKQTRAVDSKSVAPAPAPAPSTQNPPAEKSEVFDFLSNHPTVDRACFLSNFAGDPAHEIALMEQLFNEFQILKCAPGPPNSAPELYEEPFTTVVNKRSKRNRGKAK